MRDVNVNKRTKETKETYFHSKPIFTLKPIVTQAPELKFIKSV